MDIIRKFTHIEDKGRVLALSVIIEKIVVDVRNDLAKKYNISSEEYKKYRGLCDEAVVQCIDEIKPALEDIHYRTSLYTNIKSIHGEQSHHPRIPSKLWPMQHTWIVITIGKEKLYVDPTSSQFQDIYKDIPDFYISRKAPKWYYPDNKNPLWRKLKKLNNLITFSKIVSEDKCRGMHRSVTIGIVELFQYELWGNISDVIHKILKKDR